MPTASTLLPLAILVSVLAGLLLIPGAVWVAHRSKRFTSGQAALAGLAVAVLVNSWWLAFLAMVAIKFFVLKEDT